MTDVEEARPEIQRLARQLGEVFDGVAVDVAFAAALVALETIANIAFTHSSEPDLTRLDVAKEVNAFVHRVIAPVLAAHPPLSDTVH
jgi:hypothetical protein